MIDRLREQIYTLALFLMGMRVYDKKEFTEEQYKKLNASYDCLVDIYNEEITKKQQDPVIYTETYRPEWSK